MDLENLKKDFRRFILEQCASEVPIKGKEVENIVDNYIHVLTSLAKVEQLKELRL